MGRPEIPHNEYGDFTFTEVKRGKIRARAYYRGPDGRKRSAQATAPTETEARTALRERLKALISATPHAGDTLNGKSPISDLLAAWWQTIEHRAHDGDLNPDTRREYLRYRDHCNKAVGGVLIENTTALKLEGGIRAYIEKLKAASKVKHTGMARTASEIKRTLVGAFDYAVKYGIAPTNPAKDIALNGLRGEAHVARALTDDELKDIRARITAYEAGGGPKALRAADKGAGGRPRAVYLLDSFDLQLGLGCRVGELLALQWDTDIDGLEGDGPVLVTIQATLKHRSEDEAERTGKPAGPYRQEHTKNSTVRTLPVGRSTAELLRRLKADAAPGVPWVLATVNGTPRNPSNLRTALRKARGPEYDWVTPHSLRRTMVTHIVRETGSVQAAGAWAGHTNLSTTEGYLDRRLTVPNLGEVMDKLAG